MKKILMGTSALAVAGSFASHADAAEWDLDWGGYYEASIAYRDGDAWDNTDRDGVDVISDNEIIFTPSITLDNGLTFGVNVQLEGNSNVNNAPVTEGDIIDESYAFVTGSFGTIRLGSTDAAGAAMQSNAPDVSWIGASSGSLTGIIPVGGGSGTYIQPGGGDAAKIVYFTPRFSGFQVGVSYAHDGSEDKRASAGTGGRDSNDLFSVAANYVNSFGAFDVSAAGSYSTASINAAGGDRDDTHYALHLTLGYAGFSVGGSYANRDLDIAGVEDTDFFDLGVAYRTGPWGVSMQYSHTDSAASDTDQYLAAVDYKLGPGVRTGIYAGFAEQDFTAAGAGDIDGFIIGTGFRLDF